MNEQTEKKNKKTKNANFFLSRSILMRILKIQNILSQQDRKNTRQ